MEVVLEIGFERSRGQEILESGVVLEVVDFAGVIRSVIIIHVCKIVIIRIGVEGLVQIGPPGIFVAPVDAIFGVQLQKLIHAVVGIEALNDVNLIIYAAGIFLVVVGVGGVDT